jgi:hypothetical protein
MQRTNCVYIIEINRLVLLQKTTALYSENCVKRINNVAWRLGAVV